MINFFRNLGNNIEGITLGLGIGLIIALIVLAIFKQFNNKVLVSFLTIVFCIFGGVFGYRFTNKNSNNQNNKIEQSYKEIVVDVDKELKENWKHTNGGFVFEQIKKVQNDPEAPVYPDQIIEIGYQDFGDYQCFFIKEDDKYYNVTFIVQNFDNEQFLHYDGSLMNNLQFRWYGNLFNAHYELSEYEWELEQSKIPEYIRQNKWFGNFYDNQISMISQSATFVKYWQSFLINHGDMFKQGFSLGKTYVANNISEHFFKYNKNVIELVGTANTSKNDFNNCYSYLFDIAKNMKTDETKFIDVSSNGLMCVPIPQEEQKNYPIKNPEQYKTDDYEPEYYGVYNTQIAVKLTKYDANKKLTIEEEKKNVDPLDKPNIKPVTKQDVTLLNINFKQKTDSDSLDFSLKDYPITITFTTSDKFSKKLIIDSTEKLNQINNLFLPSNTTYNFTIESEKILFDNMFGTIKVGNKTGRIEFDYSYLNGYVIASVGLNPVGNVDKTQFDLSVNPVKIVLTNKTSNNVTEFVFNDNSMLEIKISKMVELGEYTYTILSDKLIFASTSGTLTITQTDRVMLFNYAYADKNYQLDISIATWSSKPESRDQVYFSLEFETGCLERLLEANPQFDKTDIVGYFYTSDGILLTSSNTRTDIIGTAGKATIPIDEDLMLNNKPITLQIKISLSESEIVLSNTIVIENYQINHDYQIKVNFTEID